MWWRHSTRLWRRSAKCCIRWFNKYEKFVRIFINFCPRAKNEWVGILAFIRKCIKCNYCSVEDKICVSGRHIFAQNWLGCARASSKNTAHRICRIDFVQRLTQHAWSNSKRSTVEWSNAQITSIVRECQTKNAMGSKICPIGKYGSNFYFAPVQSLICISKLSISITNDDLTDEKN